MVLWKRVEVAEIYEANRKVIATPDYIYIGQKIAIPPAA